MGSGFEECPVGTSGVEQGSSAVLVPVRHSERDSFVAFYEIVDRFGWSVGGSAQVPFRDPVLPA